LNRSVEKPYYFQHYTGYVGGGGGNRTRVLLIYSGYCRVWCPYRCPSAPKNTWNRVKL